MIHLRRTTCFRAIVVSNFFFIGVAVANDAQQESLSSSINSMQAPTTPLPSNLSEIERRRTTLNREISEINQTLENIKPKQKAAAERMHKYGRHFYKMTRMGLASLRGGFDSFVDYAQRIEALRHALLRDHHEHAQLSNQFIALNHKSNALSNELSLLHEQKKKIETETLVREQEQRRQTAFEHAFASSRFSPFTHESKQEIKVYSPSGRFEPESFESNIFRSKKGRLIFPIVGEAEVQPIVKNGEPAIEFRTHAGSTVRAVHAGRVVFADQYSSYGQLIILDHGQRYFTISANLNTMNVKVGDQVTTGQTIGSVNTNGVLHFEIRHGDTKLEPKDWFGL